MSHSTRGRRQTGRTTSFDTHLDRLYPTRVKLWINGEVREAPEGITVHGLLETLEIRAPHVAVEVNSEIVRRAQQGSQTLRDGDRVEIVTFVGGG